MTESVRPRQRDISHALTRGPRSAPLLSTSAASISRAPAQSCPGHLPARLFAFVVVTLAVALTLAAHRATAHELEVDTLYVRVQTASGKMSGQLMLDPDVTRPGWDSQAALAQPREVERARLLSFVGDHVVFRTGAQALDVSFDVRELYVHAGAVLGDSVVFHAALPNGWQSLTVEIGEPLTVVAVTTAIDGKPRPTFMITGAHPGLRHQLASGEDEASDADDALTGSSRPSPSIVSECLGHVWTGVVHIVPLGWDHILFVVALALGSLGRWRRLLWEISAFTAAHTVTLGLGSLQIIELPPALVEALVALSITAVALEQVVGVERAGVRYGVVTFFGLVHGLGFARALLELGFSGTSFFLFLASFNVGVELGQLAVVAATLGVFWWLARWPKALAIARKFLVVAIAACGLVVATARVVAQTDPMGAATRPTSITPVVALSKPSASMGRP